MDLRRFAKWTGTAAGVLAAAFIVILLSLEFFVSETYLARLVSKVSDNWLKGELTIGKLDLVTFSHFPYAGIELEKATIVNRTDVSPAKADTLASFDRLTILVNPIKFLRKQVDIKKIKIDAPRVYAYVPQEGAPNWDILKEMPEQTDEDESDFSLNINIREISVDNRGYFIFDSRKDALRASLFMNSLELQGRFTNEVEKIRIRKGTFSRLNMAVTQSGVNKYLSGLVSGNTDIPDSLISKNLSILANANRASMRFSIDTMDISSQGRGSYSLQAETRTNIRIAKNSIAENLPLNIKGDVSFRGRDQKSVTLDNIKIMLAKIPFYINGTVNFDNDGFHTQDLIAVIEEFPLTEFIEYIPKAIVPDIKKIKTDTRLSLKANIFGSYNPTQGTLPSADIDLSIPKSYIGIEGRKERINEMELAATYRYRQDPPDSNAITIHKVHIDGNGIMANGKGTISSLIGDPYMDLKFKGHLNLDSAIKILPPNTDIYGSGAIDASFEIKSRASNLTPYRLAKANLKGNAVAKNLNLGIPSQDIFCTVYGGNVKLGSSVLRKMKMIGVDVNIDSTYIRYANTLLVKGRDIKFNGKNEASVIDTTSKSVKPFAGSLSAASFEMRGTDSTSVRVSGTTNRFSILPYKGDYSVPSMHISSNSRRISLRQDVNFVSITDGTFDMHANLNNTETKMRELRIARLTDSLQTVYPDIPADSLVRHWMRQQRGNSQRRGSSQDDFTQDDYNFQITDKGVLYILNRWRASGKLNASRIRIATPAFPLRTRIENPELQFDLNEIKMEKGSVHSGQSSFAMSGKIGGIRRALSRGGKLDAKLTIDADTLNFNELASALAAGEEYMAKGMAYKDSLMKVSNEEALENMVAVEGADTLNTISLIIIPKNIEAELDMNIHYGIYSSITLHSAKGKVNSKNRCVQIMDFNATTSAGAMDLNAYYNTKSKEDISAGFDLQFKDMDMGELIRLYPGMDTLLPMLKSFEGIINCQIAATSQIDTCMNLKLPTIEGVARIKGDSLILLDGETFAEIAKMLKFKNRERNLVDSISVELSIKDNQIEVFPFIMKMDRYTTAISGKQDLDMNFNYHISVLKSPIPLRMGIDITGNMDNLKFRIGKALYKDTNLPVYSKMIDSTRINLVEQIKGIHGKAR